MNNKKNIYLKLLRIILWIYIIFCFVIAGLNYGYARKAPQSISKLITWIWLVYENWIKTLFIIVCAYLTIRIVGASKRTKMRKRNLMGFMIAAIIVHIFAPLFTNNFELYIYAMPLPWTTTPLRLIDENSALYQSTFHAYGHKGIIAAIIFFICISIIVLIGTLLFGRRFQCSTICLFNGFAAEVFEPAIPLIGKRKKIKSGTIKVLSIVRWIALVISLFFMFYWCLCLLGITLPPNIDIVTRMESYKYLTGELLMTMFFWIAFIGRGYCYYCPLGTVLSLLSKIAGQKITTANTKCIQCNRCSNACPMSIDIKSCAVDGIDVKNIRCVGCGHCIDECPTNNLCYSTRFINNVIRRR